MVFERRKKLKSRKIWGDYYQCAKCLRIKLRIKPNFPLFKYTFAIACKENRKTGVWRRRSVALVQPLRAQGGQWSGLRCCSSSNLWICLFGHSVFFDSGGRRTSFPDISATHFPHHQYSVSIDSIVNLD